MTEYFQGKRWAITGRLTEISRKEATAQLKAKGASVTGGVTSQTDFLVSGGFDPNRTQYLSSKEKGARQFGIPIFNEPQLLAILAGEETQLVDKLAPAKDEVATVGTRDALEGFRELVADEVDDGNWQRICELVDRCSARDLPVVLPYLESFLSQDNSRTVAWWSNTESPRYHRLDIAEPRKLPGNWVFELLGGANHPKFALARAADLRGQKIRSSIADNLLACEHLGALRALDLTNNAPSNKFWAAAAAKPEFAQLRYLAVGNSKLNAATTKALAKAPFSATLQALRLEGTQLSGNNAAAALFDRGAFERLHTLDVSGVRSPAGALHDAVHRATHLTQLRHLGWNDVEGSEWGLGHIVAAEQFSTLTHIRYTNRGLGPRSLAALANATHLDNVTRLTVFDTGWNAAEPGIEQVLEATQFGTVEELIVSVDPAGLSALMHAGHLTSLSHLHISGLRDRNEDWELLLTAPHLQSVKDLYLGALLPEGFVGRLLDSDALPNLSRLHISGTSLVDSDLYAAANATHRALTEFGAHADSGASKAALQAALDAEHLPEGGLKSSLHWALDQLQRP